MGTVKEQLDQLNGEAIALNAEVKDAHEAHKSATAETKRAALALVEASEDKKLQLLHVLAEKGEQCAKEHYEVLRKEKERLDTRRAKLEAKLPGAGKRRRELESEDEEEGAQSKLAGGSIDIVGRLLARYKEHAQRVHSGEAPGAARGEDVPLQRTRLLSAQMPLLDSRDLTYKCLLANLARIFKRWSRRNHINDGDNFRRGLAHVLILSCAGSGKTTVLEMLLRWLRKHLEEEGEEQLQHFFAWAMYNIPLEALPAKERGVVRDFLAALRQIARDPHLLAVLRVETVDLMSTAAERSAGVTADSAAALRLLYACLSPLDDLEDEELGTYDNFLESFPKELLHKLRCEHVLQFLRRALEVPDTEHLMLLVLIDEGNAAAEPFPRADGRPVKEGLTWLMEFLHALISMNSKAAGKSKDLAVPICVTTRHTAVDLRWTPSGQAEATYLPLRLLSLGQTQAVVLNLAKRAAWAAGRQAAMELSDSAAEAWMHVHWYLGGNPRLLRLFLAALGPGLSRDTWPEDLDRRILGLSVPDVPGVLGQLQGLAVDAFWKEMAKEPLARDLQLQLLRTQLAVVLLDRQVLRQDPVHDSYPLVTWGMQEADGYVKLDLQTPGGDIPLETVMPIMSSPGSASTRQGVPDAAAGDPEVSSSGAAAAQPRSSPAETSVGCSMRDTPSSATPGALEGTMSPPVAVLRPPSASKVVQRQPLGPSVADTTETSPTKQALAICDHMCPAASSQPGQEPVVPSMGILAVATLLRLAGHMKDSNLSVYSQSMVRESALDKEFSDSMAICLKLMAMAMLGYSSFSLADVCPGVSIDNELAAKRFLVPYGQLSAGKGVRLGRKLDAEATKARIDKISVDIIDSQRDRDLEKELSIGFVGTGNDGKDSCIVIVEAAETARPWAISIQSKQDTSANPSYDTCRGILVSMQSDQAATHKLPQLQGEWQMWHSSKSSGKDNNKGRGKSKDALPDGMPSAQGWNGSDWQQRVIYAYVSDRLFSREQQSVLEQLLYRGHPWMRRVLILCKWEQVAWHGRTGALLRYLRQAVLKYKDVRQLLGSQK